MSSFNSSLLCLLQGWWYFSALTRDFHQTSSILSIYFLFSLVVFLKFCKIWILYVLCCLYCLIFIQRNKTVASNRAEWSSVEHNILIVLLIVRHPFSYFKVGTFKWTIRLELFFLSLFRPGTLLTRRAFDQDSILNSLNFISFNKAWLKIQITDLHLSILTGWYIIQRLTSILLHHFLTCRPLE